jgi:AI-2 transport protein TqsA
VPMSQDHKEIPDAPTVDGGQEPDTELDGPTAPREEQPGGRRVKNLRGRLRDRPSGLLFALACATIVLYGMRYSRSILAPIFLAMFVVMGLSPILQWLKRKGVPPWAAMLMVLVVFLVVATIFIAIIATSLGQISARIPVYQEGLSRITSVVQAWFGDRGMDISGITSNVLRPDKIVGWVTASVRLLISLLSSAFLMVLIVVFMIAEAYSFPHKLRDDLLLGPRLGRAFETFGTVTRTFLFTLTWLNALTAVLVAVVYYVFRVEFPLLWALMFFLLSFIPNIGFVLALIPPFFVTLLGFGFPRAAIVVAIVIVINGVVNNSIAPRFMGRRTGLTPLAVFLSFVLWAWVLGPVGALMSVPLMLMVKLLFFESYESTQILSTFMTPSERQQQKGESVSPAVE